MYTVVRPADRRLPEYATLPFRAWRSTPSVMSTAHTHSDIEFNLPIGGTLSYFFGGRFLQVAEGQLAIFWAGIPHRLIALDPAQKTEYLCMTLPLGWFLSWRIGGGKMAQALLSGDLIARPASTLERELFERWALDFRREDRSHERIALLEVEAALHRLAGELPLRSEPHVSVGDVTAGGYAEKIAAYIGDRYPGSDLSVADIAAAIGLHPHYLLTVFKESCGMTLWEYVTGLRISHAQRLLLTTDWSVERIAQESGFISSSRFFAVFRKRTGGITPRRYRLGGSTL